MPEGCGKEARDRFIYFIINFNWRLSCSLRQLHPSHLSLQHETYRFVEDRDHVIAANYGDAAVATTLQIKLL